MTRDELAPAVKVSQNGTVIACHVQPNAARTAPAGMYGGELKVALKSPPVDGKANKELCRYFADLFSVPGSSVQLLSGQASRKKRIFIPVNPETVFQKLCL